MLYEAIKKLCERDKIRITQLERACGFANATVRKWETSSPSVEKLKKVADYFHVSVDYLLGNHTYQLSKEALQFAEQFDTLPEHKKMLLLACLYYLAKT